MVSACCRRPLLPLPCDPQELEASGAWESFMSSAGLINSPRDYGLPPEGAEAGGDGDGGGERGSSGAGGTQ